MPPLPSKKNKKTGRAISLPHCLCPFCALALPRWVFMVGADRGVSTPGQGPSSQRVSAAGFGSRQEGGSRRLPIGFESMGLSGGRTSCGSWAPGLGQKKNPTVSLVLPIPCESAIRGDQGPHVGLQSVFAAQTMLTLREHAVRAGPERPACHDLQPLADVHRPAETACREGSQ